jgi:hypothetical protein
LVVGCCVVAPTVPVHQTNEATSAAVSGKILGW